MIQPSPFEAEALLISRMGEIDTELNKMLLVQSLKPDSTGRPGWRKRSAAWISRSVFRTDPCADGRVPETAS